MTYQAIDISKLLDQFFQKFPLSFSLNLIQSLSQWDRYQASIGINEASKFVAETAKAIGLNDVSIETFPGTGTQNWWSFEAPSSWTPISAKLEARKEDQTIVITEYPRDACSIGSNSVATPEGGVTGYLKDLNQIENLAECKDHILLIDYFKKPLNQLVIEIEAHGGMGLIIDCISARENSKLKNIIGRVELPQGTKLFGFSVSPNVMNKLKKLMRQGIKVKAHVEIDKSVGMPVVSGVLSGKTDKEIWLIAHLCHPMPGANDNASGVSSLLGIAKTLNSLKAEDFPIRNFGIRFLWMPEFVGTAAYLYDVLQLDASRLPLCVLNLDMVGGGKMSTELCIESTPDYIPSFLETLIEYCAELLRKKPYNTDNWSWKITPFSGMSDHAIFADRSISRPAVQLGYFPDPFNHSSGDSLDKIIPQKFLFCSVLAGATIAFLAMARQWDYFILKDLMFHRAKKVISQASLSFLGENSSKHYHNDYLNHIKDCAILSFKSLNELHDEIFQETDEHIIKHLEELASKQLVTSHYSYPFNLKMDFLEKPLIRCWVGPFNMRGLLNALPAFKRLWFDDAMMKDKFSYTKALSLALMINDYDHFVEVLKKASFMIKVRIENEFAINFIELLLYAGWVKYEKYSESRFIPSYSKFIF